MFCRCETIFIASESISVVNDTAEAVPFQQTAAFQRLHRDLSV